MALHKNVEFKLYKRRWFMMVIFMMFTFNIAVQWGQYTVISNLVTKYYDVSATYVEWTATVFMLSYILFVFPGLYVLDKLGVRNSLLLASLGIVIGTWIKVFAVAEDRFTLLFVGQCFTGFFFMFSYSFVGRFTALWFGADEISTAGVLALLGDQFGTAFAFFVPSVIVQQGTNEVIGNGIRLMNTIVAGLSTLIFLLVVVFFKDKPKLPPCMAQIKQRQVKKESVTKALRSMFSKRAFIFILFSYGLNLGPYLAVITLLNRLISMNFPGQEHHAGKIGGLMMVSGMINSFVAGRILDKTRKFKESAIILTTCSTMFLIVFTWSLRSGNLSFVYISAAFLGFFCMGYNATGFQMGIEVTYPISEGISTAVAFFASCFFSFAFTIIYGYTVTEFGDLISNIGLIVVYAVTVVLTMLIPADLKRQEAEETGNERELKDLMHGRKF